MSPSSYGHTYLTSYGWTGSGTGLRKGAIDKPLAIPPKKNINGLGKDRDEAFPFWDHLFTVASKAITIKLSNDDEDTDDDESKVPREGDPDTDANYFSSSDPLRRTTTGILSNRRPAPGTPATTSGSTTPDPAARPSLLATAKREAAKRGLYAHFFRGPVLGPDDEGPSAAASPTPTPTPSPSPSFGEESSGSRFKLASASKSSLVSAFTPEVAERIGDRDKVGNAKKNKKRRSKNDGEKMQQREQKRLKREYKAARAAKRAEKALKKQKEKDPLDGGDRKDRRRQDEGIGYKGDGSKKARKHLPKSEARLDPEKRTRRTLEPTSEQQETLHEPQSSDVVPASKKKRKRKDTPS